MFQPKPLFKKRVEALLPDKKDRDSFWQILKTEPKPSIRCNTLKISPEKLKKRLKKRDWKISQPFSDFPEIIQILNNLSPGELGKTKEHLLGYYYIQEISSMLPVIALNPNENDILLDLCAAPGSKTTQASIKMKNSGAIIANDPDLGRIRILAANLEKISSSNTAITRHDGAILCDKLKKLNFKASKILTDVPCSGEGNIRSNKKTLLMWNIKVIEKLSRIQKKLASSTIKILNPQGELLYSTCTHSPEENEQNIQYLIDNFPLKIQPIELPKELKIREGITKWQGKKFHKDMSLCARIYPQDNNTEGFFLCKLKKLEK